MYTFEREEVGMEIVILSAVIAAGVAFLTARATAKKCFDEAAHYFEDMTDELRKIIESLLGL